MNLQVIYKLLVIITFACGQVPSNKTKLYAFCLLVPTGSSVSSAIAPGDGYSKTVFLSFRISAKPSCLGNGNFFPLKEVHMAKQS